MTKVRGLHRRLARIELARIDTAGKSRGPAAGLGVLGIACLMAVGCARDNGALQTAFDRVWGFGPGPVVTAVREAPRSARSAADSIGRLVERVKPRGGEEAWAVDPFLADNLADDLANDLADADSTDAALAEADDLVVTADADPGRPASGDSAAQDAATPAGAADGTPDDGVMLVQNPPVVSEISSADGSNPFAGLTDNPPAETAEGSRAAAPSGTEDPFAGLNADLEEPSASPLVQLKDSLNNDTKAGPTPPRISPEAARAEIDRLMLACRQEMRRGEFAIALRIALVAEQLADSAEVFFGPEEEQPGDVVVKLRDRVAVETVANGTATPSDAPSDPLTDAPTDTPDAPSDALAAAPPDFEPPSEADAVAGLATETPPAAEEDSAAEEGTAEEGVETAENVAATVPNVADAPGVPVVRDLAPPDQGTDRSAAPSAAPLAPGPLIAPRTPIVRSTGLPTDSEPAMKPIASSAPSSIPSESHASRELPVRYPDTGRTARGATEPTDGLAHAGPDGADLHRVESNGESNGGESNLEESAAASVPSAPEAVIVTLMPPELGPSDAPTVGRGGSPPVRATANQAASLGPAAPEPLPSRGVARTEPTKPWTPPAPSMMPGRRDAFATATLASPVAPPPPLPEDHHAQRPYDFLYGPENRGGASAGDVPPPVPDLSWEDEAEAVEAGEPGPAPWLLPVVAGSAILLTTLLVLRRRR